jgi:hypothetical protein
MAAHCAVGKAALLAAEKTIEVYLQYYDARHQYWSRKELGQERFFYLKRARGLAEMRNHSPAVQRWAVARVFDGEFESLREALAASSRLVRDETDGIELWLDPATTQTIHRVEVTQGWSPQRERFGDNGQMLLLRQQHTGRSFHEAQFTEFRQAVKEALAAWHRQAVVERQEANLVAFLRGDRGFSPLIYRGESYRAGNCSPGTEAWLQRHGWSGREFIPGQWLIPFLAEGLVRNVAMIAYRDLS